MQPQYPHIDVEPMFNLLVEDYGGGVLLGDFIRKQTGNTPTFENADYLFHSEKVVAELKCLTEDNTQSPNKLAKIKAAVEQYYADGKIKSTEVSEEAWKSFPRHLQNDFYTILTTSIQRAADKANRQIRETKEQLGLKDYTGMLLIANDGLLNVPPAMFIQAVEKHVSPNCRHINYFVYLTANIFTKLKDVPAPSLFWIAFDLQNGPPMDKVFTDRLFTLWKGVVSRKTQMPGFSKELTDMEDFWKAKHM